ncbi:MAG: phosphoenolpyruvate--protein phosphotransferase [Planctomycetes bacterium]|nr:phosphoenolpyruvate--protein phosphotransferase [Planctomycetota bacterium]
MSLKLKGVAAASGIAVAPLVHFHGDLAFIPTRSLAAEEVAAERRRLEEAIESAADAILVLSRDLAAELTRQDIRIYDAQLALLHDKTLQQELFRTIEQDRVNSEVAIQQVVARYETVFERMEDVALRERAADLRDVGRQVLSVLLERERKSFVAEGQDYVFAAEEFLPSDAGTIDRKHLRGIVTARGGKYSHGAILARSLGIPAVVAVDELLQRIRSGTRVVVDGESGVVIGDPDDEEVERYRHLAHEQAEAERRVFEVRYLSSRTPDGAVVRLLANVESTRDLSSLERDITDGIGLFRTEFAFMERHQFPTEEEQVALYRKAIEWADGKTVTFRTLDVGGDKPLRYFKTPDERNPVLGWRGLRISLDLPDLFYTQIRALLRASAGGHARILLPMVTAVDEVARCRAVVDEIKRDLAQAGEPHDPDIELGAMIEVPAIAHVLDQVMPLCDFASVGTNDLVQYMLACDRDNPRIAHMYTPYHPAVIRLLAHIAEVVGRSGKPVSICGEIAGDHYFTSLLLGLGFRELSMAPVFLPRVKLMVRTFPIDECERLAKEALGMANSRDVRALARDLAKTGWSRFLEHGQS